MELNQSFLEEKSRLERRLGLIDEELTERARELLKLETILRELAVSLIDRIEIGEKHPVTGQQEVKVFWRFYYSGK